MRVWLTSGGRTLAVVRIPITIRTVRTLRTTDFGTLSCRFAATFSGGSASSSLDFGTPDPRRRDSERSYRSAWRANTDLSLRPMHGLAWPAPDESDSLYPTHGRRGHGGANGATQDQQCRRVCPRRARFGPLEIRQDGRPCGTETTARRGMPRPAAPQPQSMWRRREAPPSSFHPCR